MHGSAPKPQKFLQPEILEAVLRRCAQVGDMQLQEQPTAHNSKEDKEDGTPVTKIDRISESMMVNALEQLTPHIPVISEELDEKENLETIKHPGKIWMLDPLDGTKNYLAQSPEFSIHLALMSEPDETGNRTPLAGIVYVPATRSVFYTIEEGRAYKATLNDGSGETMFAGTPEPLKGNARIPGITTPGNAPEYLRIGVTKEVAEADEKKGQCHFFDSITDDPQVKHVVNRSMEVCAGNLDAAYCSHTLSAWDIAAMDAITRACGRMMLPIDSAKNRITADRYDYRGTHYDGKHFRVPAYITVTPELVQHIPHPPSLDRQKTGVELQ